MSLFGDNFHSPLFLMQPPASVVFVSFFFIPIFTVILCFIYRKPPHPVVAFVSLIAILAGLPVNVLHPYTDTLLWTSQACLSIYLSHSNWVYTTCFSGFAVAGTILVVVSSALSSLFFVLVSTGCIPLIAYSSLVSNARRYSIALLISQVLVILAGALSITDLPSTPFTLTSNILLSIAICGLVFSFTLHTHPPPTPQLQVQIAFTSPSTTRLTFPGVVPDVSESRTFTVNHHPKTNINILPRSSAPITNASPRTVTKTPYLSPRTLTGGTGTAKELGTPVPKSYSVHVHGAGTAAHTSTPDPDPSSQPPITPFSFSPISPFSPLSPFEPITPYYTAPSTPTPKRRHSIDSPDTPELEMCRWPRRKLYKEAEKELELDFFAPGLDRTALDLERIESNNTLVSSTNSFTKSEVLTRISTNTSTSSTVTITPPKPKPKSKPPPSSFTYPHLHTTPAPVRLRPFPLHRNRKPLSSFFSRANPNGRWSALDSTSELDLAGSEEGEGVERQEESEEAESGWRDDPDPFALVPRPVTVVGSSPSMGVGSGLGEGAGTRMSAWGRLVLPTPQPTPERTGRRTRKRPRTAPERDQVREEALLAQRWLRELGEV
ncbi:hypothetical protein VNI00_003849 [Paramarasmius palmivorus]|uniref:NADH dehydrogenase subunit 6 n=1 Tax=Paramarasmius palmivorus TaxID=297713 RepID=A0AAW0DML6_9AGAR